MMPSRKIYNCDGSESYRQFLCDYDFATEALDFVKNLPDGNRWILWKCERIALGVYQVSFQTNEYLSPGRTSDVLRVKAVHSDSDFGWTFSKI